MNQGLKNRGRRKEDVEDRRKAVEEHTGTKLNNIASISFDPIMAEKNIENMIGCVQVPLGFAGPLKVNGASAQGEFLVPMATTEGALLASVNRGCSVITASGGAKSIVVQDHMTRAPVFRVRDVGHGNEVSIWVEKNLDLLKKETEKTTRHGRLKAAQPFIVGRSLFIRFAYETGDAMGMNMATIASETLAHLIERETGAVLISVSGNVCVDKKPAAIDAILGRGKMVLADVRVPEKVLEDKMHCSPGSVFETCYRKCQVGSSLSCSFGSNAHVANMLAAIYIATGQDPAQVVEGSMGTTTCEMVDDDLYISVRLPCVEVGTVGGGTRLPCQQEALKMIDCLGEGRSIKLAEIVGAIVLAGELSTLSAQTAGHLASAHEELGR